MSDTIVYVGYTDGIFAGVVKIEKDAERDLYGEGVSYLEGRATFAEARQDVVQVLEAKAREYKLAAREMRSYRKHMVEDRTGVEPQ